MKRQVTRHIGAWGPYALHADAYQYVVSRQGRALGYYRDLHRALERIVFDAVKSGVTLPEAPAVEQIVRRAHDEAVAAVAAIAAQPAEVTRQDLRAELACAVLHLTGLMRARVLPLYAMDSSEGLQLADAMHRVVAATMGVAGPLATLDRQSSNVPVFTEVDVDHVSTTAARCAGNGAKVCDAGICGCNSQSDMPAHGVPGSFTRHDCDDDANAWMQRVGQHAAGRLLDGVLHDEYPGVTP